MVQGAVSQLFRTNADCSPAAYWKMPRRFDPGETLIIGKMDLLHHKETAIGRYVVGRIAGNVQHWATSGKGCIYILSLIWWKSEICTKDISDSTDNSSVCHRWLGLENQRGIPGWTCITLRFVRPLHIYNKLTSLCFLFPVPTSCQHLEAVTSFEPVCTSDCAENEEAGPCWTPTLVP